MRALGRTIRVVTSTVALSLLGATAFAHHSGAMFDQSKEVTLTGTVKEFQFTNPHSWVQLVVSDGKGGTDEWSIEGARPNDLMRNGWRRTTLKPGDKIEYTIHPAKDGSHFGGGVKVKLLSTGETLWVYQKNPR